jgi:hypothetical protein
MRGDDATSGCVLTGAIWLLATLAMLGPIMGDCLPELGHTCATDHERNMSLLRIALAAVAINIGALWLFVFLRRRGGK